MSRDKTGWWRDRFINHKKKIEFCVEVGPLLVIPAKAGIHLTLWIGSRIRSVHGLRSGLPVEDDIF